MTNTRDLEKNAYPSYSCGTTLKSNVLELNFCSISGADPLIISNFWTVRVVCDRLAIVPNIVISNLGREEILGSKTIVQLPV